VEPWRGDESLDLARIIGSARRWWWAMLVGAAAGVALAVAAGEGGGSGYRATAKLLVGPIGGDYSLLRAAGRQAETFADLATSEPVLIAARSRLRTRRTVPQLRSDVVAKADDVTRLLTITAQAEGPAEAAATANAVAAELQRKSRPDDAQHAHELTVVEPAVLPVGVTGYRSKTLAAIAAMTGVLGALTVVVLLDHRRRRASTGHALPASSGAGPA
jgi:polysaccharide biosynthesis transport protein